MSKLLRMDVKIDMCLLEIGLDLDLIVNVVVGAYMTTSSA